MKFEIENGSRKVTGTIVEFGKVNEVGDVYAPGCFKNLKEMNIMDHSFQGHQATCDCSGGDKCERKNGTGEGEMRTIDKKFVCPCGEYIQFTIGENGNPVYPFSFGTWYPIESAPKDGTEILVLDYSGNQSVAKWVEVEDVEDRSTIGNMKYWQGVCCGWKAWTGKDELYFECEKITHWTPLPELPKE